MNEHVTGAVTAHGVSVVIPVYRGRDTLQGVVTEILKWSTVTRSQRGSLWQVSEILLVHDCGPDDSATVIRELVAAHPQVHSVWLSRNYGQHAASLAGMASSGGEWIVTMDEDGQHDPADIGILLDHALETGSALVYARPINPPPHGGFRNWSSRLAKAIVNKLSGGEDARLFNSYRLMLGEVGRSVAAYAGAGVYLDVALGWVVADATSAPVKMRDEGGRASGYSTRTLLSHFWRMVLTGGTRPLRAVSVMGVVFAVGGLVLSVYLLVNKLTGAPVAAGWTSLVVVILICTGALLFALGVIAEYLGVAVNMAMGKPLYLITSDRQEGPLGRKASRA